MFQDRIKELRRVPVEKLVDNPWNWRVHSGHQREALSAVYESVGVVNGLLVRELSDGNYQIIDGHLRRSLHNEQGGEVPVLVLDVNDDEAKQILVTHDPIGSWAVADLDALDNLMASVDMTSLNDDMTLLFEDLRDDQGLSAITLQGIENGAEHREPMHLPPDHNHALSNQEDVRLFALRVPNDQMNAFKESLTELGEKRGYENTRADVVAYRALTETIANELE